MRNGWKMLLVCLLCLALLSVSAVSLAETTTLELSLTGLTALADGSWRTEEIGGSFDVYQGGQSLGRIDVPAGGSASIELKDGSSVTLIPVMDTMPEGYVIHTVGYAVAVTAGQKNLAAMNVCADAGLFTLQAEGETTFTLTAEDGTVQTLTTDEEGWYASPEALPSGVYTVHQEAAAAGAEPWPDFLLTLTAYQGLAEEIVAVDLAYALEAAVEAEEPGDQATPTPEAETAEEPAAEPTEEPTATPAPTPVAGVLKLLANGSASYLLTLGDESVAEGTLTADQPEALTGLEPGEYTVTLSIPQGMVMTALNGQTLALKDRVQWQAQVKAGIEGTYNITLSALASVSGSIAGTEDVGASLSGTGQAAVTDGQYAWTELLPGEYTVTLTLPEGDYAAEGWTLQPRDGGVEATITVQADGEVRLPLVERLANAAVSGRVLQADGTGLSGVTVTLTAEDGTSVDTTSDSSGAWGFEGLADGSYTVHAQAGEGLAVTDATVTLISGRQETDVLLKAGAPASLRVHVFLDGNNNGKQGSYERGLEGVAVGAVPADNLSAAPLVTALTDKNGDALLEGLAPGQYVLRVQMPNGYAFAAYGGEGDEAASVMQKTDQQLQDSAVITLEEGQTAVCGVGASSMAVVSGYVWLDENGDGVRQDDEHGQAGCLIELVLRGGDTMYQLVTGEDGNYIFGAVEPGEYNIRATTPDGLMFTQYTKYGGDKRSILTTEGVRKATKLVKLSAGKTLDEQNIGLVYEGVIQVQCFLDANFNGLYDEGEEPLAGVKGELIKQGTGKTVVTKTSDENGIITFDALRANTYRLRAVLPEGAAFTMVTDDPAGNHFQPRTGRRENYVDNIVVTTGTTQQMVVGAVLPATVTGVCYLDDNFSATRDGSEKVVSGLTVSLVDKDGNTVATDRTTAKGVYTFENVNPGTYTIAMNAKKGYAFTKLGEGNIMVNQGGGAGVSTAFEVAIGQSVTGMDVGMILPGTVQGTVFADENDNGLMDEGETGLAGTEVRLMDENGEWFCQTVGEDGSFCFDAVMPGRYYLRYNLPERGAFARTDKDGNTITGENGLGAGEWFDFKVGSTVNAPLCGGLILGQVDGTAFADHDGSGLMDAGEATLSGVTLTLTPSRSDLEPVTVTTGSDGAFLLADLHPDTYTLTVSMPEGLVTSRVTGTTLPVSAGSAGQSVTLTVTMGDTWSGQLLGGAAPASLAGSLWLDVNNNGLWDDGDATPAGEQVEIIDQLTGEVFAVMTTDSQGSFGTDSLIPGSYALRFALDENTIAPLSGDSDFTREGDALMLRNVQLAEGASTQGLKLGIVRYTNLGGQVWVDQGGEIVPLSGAEVILSDSQGNRLNAMTTAEDGTYRFGQLLPGVYAIGVSLPEGQVVVEPDDERLTSGGQVSIMTECSGRSGMSGAIEVRMGEDQLDLDIGSVLPGRLGDLAWLDENGNGLLDSGEGGIPGVQVELLRGDTVVAQTVTDQYGFYVFDELYPATYTLRVTAPAQVKPTTLRTDFPGIVSVLEEADGDTFISLEVSVASNRSNYNADLGFVLRVSGEYPAGYGQGATQDWTKISDK
ncbi:MAG: SdrD B-like domain-containing protein [Aristaeellaceae bacterium]